MRVLVTGGGGFLGSRIVARLAARGDTVCVLGRRSYSHLPVGVRSVQADIRDASAIHRACSGMEAVIHTAALPGIWGNTCEFESINVEGTRNVVEACRKQGVAKLVHTSSPSVVYADGNMENINESVPYPDIFLCDYARTKATAERLVLEANGLDGLHTVALRPHLIWGPGDPHLVPRLVERAQRGRLVRVGNGANKVDIIYIDNVVEGHINALDADSRANGKCYFLSDGHPVVLWDWINELLSRLGLPTVKKSISYKTGYALGALLEGVYGFFKLPGEPRMTRFLAAQLATSHFFDISRARDELGYRPVVSVEEGMKRLIESLRRRPGD
jgi:nucleoside-diphosphate-sugar epimerase